MIGIGIILLGPELQAASIYDFLRATRETLDVVRGDWKEGASPLVVVVFVVPGSFGDVNFTGQRRTLFSRKKKLLQIEAAVPQEVVDAGGDKEFVIDALRQACATAAEVFARKGPEDFDLLKAESLIEKIRVMLDEGIA